MSSSWLTKTMRRVHLKHTLLFGVIIYVAGLGFFMLPPTDRRSNDPEWDHQNRSLQRRLSRVAHHLARNLTLLAQLESALLVDKTDELSRDEVSESSRVGFRAKDRKEGGKKQTNETMPRPWDDPESPGES